MEKIKRMQIYLEHELYIKLKREAFEEGISMSSFLRGILKRHFYAAPERSDIRKIIGIFNDQARDVAVNHDDYLTGTGE
jgi:hypothetical protein